MSLLPAVGAVQIDSQGCAERKEDVPSVDDLACACICKGSNPGRTHCGSGWWGAGPPLAEGTLSGPCPWKGR